MATITSDEECLPVEETGRRTRSGRKSSTNSAAVTPARATRRSSRKTISDEKSVEEDHLSAVIETTEEITADILPAEVEYSNADKSPKSGMKAMEAMILAGETTQIEDDDEFLSQSSQPVVAITLDDEEELLASPMNEQIVEQSEQPLESAAVLEAQTTVELNDDDDEMADASEKQIEQMQIIEEKSSSFPFACDGSTERTDCDSEAAEQGSQVDSIDNLLANLAEDNANSLPSAGGNEDDDEESRSQNATAEDVQNGDSQKSESSNEMPTEQNEVSNFDKDDDVKMNEKESDLKTSPVVIKRKLDEGYDPNSPTEESSEVSPDNKKSKVDEDEDSLEAVIKKDPEPEKKALPDLEKYWKTVRDNPADFTGWTYLLQYVDQENDIEAAREAYDAFLSHYPYCYGYWRKYADYEKRKGNKDKCDEVFERGLAAIPLSVDLWIHYLTHAKSKNVDDEEYIRSQFERAIAACGLEFRSDKLWEAYIKWEKEGSRIRNIISLYDRLLATPTQGYNSHFDHFQEVVNNNTLSALLSLDDMAKMRAEVRSEKAAKEKHKETDISDMPPGEDESDYNVRNEEETTAIKEKLIAPRRKLHKQTVSAVTGRWVYEEGIKRPYFHVKALERCQLKNWKDYIDYEIEHGDRKRVLVLFERCLIACALYDEFWLKLIRYLESLNDPELIPSIRDVFRRACEVHHPDKPSLHLMWSGFEECQNDFDKAADILIKLEKTCPDLLQIAYRRINLERRRSNYTKCVELYEHYIRGAKNKSIAGSLAIKYARYCHKVMNNLEAGFEVLRKALHDDASNTRVALQMIDMSLQRNVVNEEEVVAIMDSFMSRDDMEPDQRVLFAQRKVEFLEDFGQTSKGLQEAQRALQVALSKANEAKKKASESSQSKKSSKESSHHSSSSASGSAASASAASSQSAAYNYNYAGQGTGYYQGAATSASYPGYGDYSGYNYYPSSYGYGQWGSQSSSQSGSGYY